MMRSPATTPRGARLQHRTTPVASMERALRTLSPGASPVPQTPRPKPGGGGRAKKSFKATPHPNKGRRSSVGANTGGEEAVKVAIRVRPLAPNGDQCAGRAWRASSDRNAIAQLPGSGVDSYTTPGKRRSLGESEYYYDRVFGEDANTSEIYSQMVSEMVESVAKEGINGTVFAYGQTSSGKTFTMQGAGSEDSVGVVQLAARDIFQLIKEENVNTECTVKVSYVEIYNEELRDLLNNRRSATSLLIREDKKGSISVEGLKEVAVGSPEQLLEVFRVGEANKSVGATKMNDRSSRSHAILKIVLERKTVLTPGDDPAVEKENDEGNGPADLVVKTTSALNLVDLAGSESVRHTGATGTQKKEGGMINQSLLTLSKVLMSLGQKNPGHINYRDSKLTRILKPSLSGNARMAVICCISPSDKYVEETKSTLQFATRAKLVKTHAVANEEVEDQNLIAKLRLESVKAKVENQKLADRLREMEGAMASGSAAAANQRELDNLRKFVFSATPAAQKRLALSPESLTDDHCNAKRGRMSDTALLHPRSKCDLHMLVSHDDDASRQSHGSGTMLRAALSFKAKQVKNLQSRLKGSRHKRYSLISEARSPEMYRSMARVRFEGRSPEEDDAEPARHSKPQDVGQYQAENEQLESKLANANNLIAGLERQIDDLTSQKNDALDWIEELFAKSDQKDDKIQQVSDENAQASRRCTELEGKLATTRELLQSTRHDLELSNSQKEELIAEAKVAEQAESADKVEGLHLELASAKEKYEASQEQLLQARREVSDLLEDRQEADVEMRDLKATIVQLTSERDGLSNARPAVQLEANKVLKSQVQELEDFTSEYAEERRSLVNQIEQYEDQLSHADALLKAKSDQLDDALFSLDKEKKHWLNEKKALMEQVEGGAVAPVPVVMESSGEAGALTNENENLVAEQLSLMKNFSDLSTELKETNRQLEGAKQDQETCAKNAMYELKKNKKLTNELDFARRDLDERQERVDCLERELAAARRQQGVSSEAEMGGVHQEVDRLKAENVRLRSERRHLEEDFKQCCDKMDALSSELDAAQQQNDGASQERVVQLETENSALLSHVNEANSEIKQLYAEVQDTKRELNRLQNAKNDELKRSVAKIQHLVEALTSDNAELKEKNEALERARDSPSFRPRGMVREKDSVRMKLDKIAADFECDYETVRSKIDSLLEEKNALDDRVAFLEASKASVETNADRILERDNALAGRHDRLKAEYKKQTMRTAELEDEVSQLVRRLARLKGQVGQLHRDNHALKDMVQSQASRSRHVAQSTSPGDGKRRVIFGFRPHNK
ncbi:hypothetical protein ACHAXT_010293 [Thalassiosira profunda]